MSYLYNPDRKKLNFKDKVQDFKNILTPGLQSKDTDYFRKEVSIFFNKCLKLQQKAFRKKRKNEKKLEVQKSLNNLIQNEIQYTELAGDQLFTYFYKHELNIPKPRIKEIYFEDNGIRISFDSDRNIEKNFSIFVGSPSTSKEILAHNESKAPIEKEKPEKVLIVEQFFEEGKIIRPTISKLYRDMLRDLFISGLFFLKFLKNIPAE